MEDVYRRIAADPAFRALSRRRSRFNWTLTVVLLVVYYVFIAVIAFRPELFAIPLADDSVVSWGIPIGFSVIVLSLVLTGVYILKSNRDFDPALRNIIQRLERAAND